MTTYRVTRTAWDHYWTERKVLILRPRPYVCAYADSLDWLNQGLEPTTKVKASYGRTFHVLQPEEMPERRYRLRWHDGILDYSVLGTPEGFVYDQMREASRSWWLEKDSYGLTAVRI